MNKRLKNVIPATLRRPLPIFFLLLLLVAVTAGVWHGVRLYLRFGPVDVCEKVPVIPGPDVKPFKISDPDAGEILGSHSHLACPEAPRAYFEWYALRVHSGQHFMDVLFETRDRDHSWGVAGFGIWDRQLFQPAIGNFEIGEDGHWPERGADVSLSTLGSSGSRETSFFRLLSTGPKAGSFEVKIFTKRGELHLFLTPLVPGALWKDVGAERTRPGSWFQYHIVTLMGRVEGEIKIFHDGRAPEVFKVPAAPGEQAFAYCEHMWGQSDRTPKGVPSRYYWDWGNWGRPEEGSVILFAQVDGMEGDIRSMVAVGADGELPYSFTHNPPVSYARNVYSRLADNEGYLYPQELKLWAFRPGDAGTVNAPGFVRASYGNWQAYDLWARAGVGQHQIDWTAKPVWSVTDFYKGAQVQELIPAPVKDLSADCDDQGCQVSWSLSGPRREDVEFWVLRLDPGGRLAFAEPVAVVEEVLEGASAETKDEDEGRFAWSDIKGGEGSIYQVVPVYTPETLFHQRLMAGYERVSEPPEFFSGPRETPSELQGIMEGAGASDWSSAVNEVMVLGGNRKLRLERDSSGTWELRLSEDGGPADRYQVLRPRFSKRTQVQSLAAADLGDNIVAAAWSERVPVMDSGLYTDWEIFVSVVNLESGAFHVTPISMSDHDDFNVSLRADGGVLMVSWLSCLKGSCREARERLEPVTPP